MKKTKKNYYLGRYRETSNIHVKTGLKKAAQLFSLTKYFSLSYLSTN